MRRCWGITRNLRRCGRMGNWLMFCGDHRLQPLGWLFAVFTVAAGVASMQSAWLPRVRVVPPIEAADRFHPYELEFSVRNDGTLPIYGVDVQCIPHRFQVKVLRTLPSMPGPSVANLRFVADKIPSGKARPFTCDVIKWPPPPDGVNGFEATYAELGVIIKFRPVSFLPWTWVATQAFMTYRQADGTLHWREYTPALQSAPATYPPQ